MAKATNIVGEDHKEYVHKQIRARQEILGKNLRSSEELAYINSRSSWVRLISSVDISDQDILILSPSGSITESDDGKQFKLDELGLNNEFAGAGLASSLSLMAGTQPASGSLENQLKYGVVDSQFNQANGPLESRNYGFGGTDFGLKAAPGITSFSTKNLNKGALRISTINLIANNQEQFKYIETLYLRLGYTVLIEFGDSSFFRKGDNDINEYISSIEVATYSLADEFINLDKIEKEENETTLEYFYRRIEENKESSQGNYDAVLGKVRNFDWNLTPQGLYEISLEIVSIGDVVESFTISQPLSSIDPEKIYLDTTEEEVEIEGIQYTSALEAFIKIAGHFPERVGSKDKNKSDIFNIVKNKLVTTNKGTSSFTSKSLSYSLSEDNIIACRGYFNAKRNARGTATVEGAIEERFIRFKTLLDFINSRLLIYDQEKNPIIKIDTNVDTNLGYSNGYQISSNPQQVLVRNGFTLSLNQDLFEDVTVNCFDSPEEKAIEKFHDVEGDSKYCKILNLYFNTKFLLKVLDKELDTEEQKIDLFSFLKTLLNAANSSLGSVNKFNLRLSTENTLQIYDEVRPVPYKPLIETTNDPSQFNLYGINGGSFISDYGIKSQLSKNFSNQISIGAQAGGRAVGEDATFFSKWNLGLKDRIVPKKLDYSQAISNELKDRKQVKQLLTNYLFFLNNYGFYGLSEEAQKNLKKYAFVQFLDVAIFPFELDNISKSTKAQKDFFQYALGVSAQQKGVLNPTVGFIPISLNLTMDGISGLRLFDKLRIDDRILPINYQNSIDFIIKTLSHSIQNNKWVTQLETLSVPRFEGDTQATLELGTELITEEIFITDNNNDSYLSFLSSETEILRALDSNFGTTTNKPNTERINLILKGLNKSLYFQNQFKGFFNEILSTLPKGIEIQVNSVYRPIGSNIKAGGVKGSSHQFGLAIDMQINEARENRSGNLPTFNANTSGTRYAGNALRSDTEMLQRWRNLDIPRIAEKYGITWGQNYTVAGKADYIHFSIDAGESRGGEIQYRYQSPSILGDRGISIDPSSVNSWRELSDKITTDFKTLLPYVSYLFKKSNYGKSVIINKKKFKITDNIANGINIKDLVEITEANNIITYTLNPDNLVRETFINTFTTDYIKTISQLFNGSFITQTSNETFGIEGTGRINP